MAIGESFSIDASITNNGSASNYNRNTARTSDGRLFAVYYKDVSGNNQVFCAISSDEGETWTPTQLSNVAALGIPPDICVTNDDHVHVVYRHATTTSETYIQVVHQEYDGSSWGNYEDVTSGDFHCWHPVIAADSDDNLHVAYRRQRAGYSNAQVGYSKWNGSNWSGTTWLHDDDYAQNAVSICVNTQDHIHVFWEGKNSVSPSFDQIRHNWYTSSWQGVENVTNTAYYNESINCAIDSNDYIHLVYLIDEHGASNQDVMYIKYTDSWQAPVQLADGETYGQLTPTISIDQNDTLYVVWDGKHAGSSTHYQIRYRYNDGSWSEINNLTSEGQDQRRPRLIWAMWPGAIGAKTNRPATGFCFSYADDDTDFRYYKSNNLTWENTMATIIKTWSAAVELAKTPVFGGSVSVLAADQAYDYTNDVDLETSGNQGCQVIVETKLNFSASRGRGAPAVPGGVILDVFASLDGSLYDTIPYKSFLVKGEGVTLTNPDGDFKRFSFLVHDLAHFRIGLRTTGTEDTYDYRITYQLWILTNS